MKNDKKLFYKGKCNKCGMCCKAISLGKVAEKHHKEWQEWLKENDPKDIILTKAHRDGIFIAKNWVEITKKEALSINPNIGKVSNYFVKCKALINNQCSKYSERPNICKYYPNYTNTKNTKPIGLINKIDCGFYLDK